MTYALKDHNTIAGNVLVIGSPFSLLGQYARTAIGGYIATDTVVVGCNQAIGVPISIYVILNGHRKQGCISMAIVLIMTKGY